ncbi:MAG TPA: RagB/SusD family nutrient uptake outer membrane protein [Parapedobacter sp.]|nr:RagB/SusD family nutrient uptake outer membrane protein [Parapedobacter sp.]
MKIYKQLYPLLVIITLTVSIVGCEQSYLDQKPNSGIIQPSTLEDFQGLLDNFSFMNQGFPALPQLACDDYYFVSLDAWQSARTAVERNSYVWDVDVYGGEVGIDDWNRPYETIFYANSIIDNIDKVNDRESDIYRNIKGSAYFIRAFALFELTKNYAAAYDETTAESDLGVPIKLTANIDELRPRSSVAACYAQIVSDLAVSNTYLVDEKQEDKKNRPSKLAVYALAARVSLSMRHYEKAYEYADSALTISDQLLDYNTLDQHTHTPFPVDNMETIFSACLVGYSTIGYRSRNESINIDSMLMASYAADDLRPLVFFEHLPSGLFNLKTGYFGSGLSAFNGLAMDEVYLIKAECAARFGNTEESLGILNKLLLHRFKTDTFVPLTASNAVEVLELVKAERRKELVWRGLRWDDLKRYNKEGADITLERNLGDTQVRLLPNSPRWIFNIPHDEILRSDIIQNER